MKVHLIDGTYELFRHFYGAPSRKSPDGNEIGATIGLLRSMMALLTKPDTTHIACAFDHVIESFRNDLYPGYKTGEGMDPDLHGQFGLAEEAVAALGITVWPMVEFEADDALATGACRFDKLKCIDQVFLCSPDKDLAQMVSGNRIVCLDRRREQVLDETAVQEKFGVPPESIPDWLALVGDNADGYPGISGWGGKSAATVLAHYKHLDKIPREAKDWQVAVRGAARLACNLSTQIEDAYLFRKLATLRRDVPLKEDLNELEWKGPRADFRSFCSKLGQESIADRDIKK